MSATIESDEDGGGKKITKKETRMLLAINAAEPVLIDSMMQEMRNDGCRFDVEKFVDVFRKYTAHFVQMLSFEGSDSDDDDDDDPLPKKYLSFLTAFSKSRDKFIAAIMQNYKVMCKKDLKEINFSVFKSHPEEIFKSYEKPNGYVGQSSPASLYGSQLNTCSSMRHNEENIAPSMRAIDDSLNRMNLNDVSVDTDHGSLLSAQEEELRKTMESESDTPTPTVEDWHAIDERRESREWASDLNKTPIARAPIDRWMEKSRDAVHEAVALTVPPVGQMTQMTEYRRPQTLSPLSTHRPQSATLPSPNRYNNGHSTSDIPPSKVVSPIVSTASNPIGGGVPPNSAQSLNNGEEIIREDANIEDRVNIIMNGLKDTMREVHQDLRFALPPMMERAVRAHLMEKKAITLKELIGEEYADDRLEKFVMQQYVKDVALMQLLEIQFSDGGDNHLVHLRHVTSRGKEKSESRKDDIIDRPTAPLLNSINYVNFYSEPSTFPMHLKKSENDVIMAHYGRMTIVYNKWFSVVERQLRDLLGLEMDHLNLSNARQLEKGKAVVLRSDAEVYCRGVIQEDFDSESNGKRTVRCLLVDYGVTYEIPIERMYAFPLWTDSIPPARYLCARLDAYPRGGSQFTQSDWEAITILFDEWKKQLMDIIIIRREEDTFVIDLRNGEGGSFIDVLVDKGLVQKELTRLPSSPSFPQSSSRNSLEPPSLGLLPTTLHTGGGSWKDIVKDDDSCPAIPASMTVLNASIMNPTPSSLIVKSEEPVKRDFLEIPSSTGIIPSLLQFVPQPAQFAPPPVMGLNTRKIERGLVQILNEDE